MARAHADESKCQMVLQGGMPCGAASVGQFNDVPYCVKHWPVGVKILDKRGVGGSVAKPGAKGAVLTTLSKDGKSVVSSNPSHPRPAPVAIKSNPVVLKTLSTTGKSVVK